MKTNIPGLITCDAEALNHGAYPCYRPACIHLHPDTGKTIRHRFDSRESVRQKVSGIGRCTDMKERIVDEQIRLIPYNQNDAVSFCRYQDADVCKQVDNRDTLHDLALLHRM